MIRKLFRIEEDKIIKSVNDNRANKIFKIYANLIAD